MYSEHVFLDKGICEGKLASVNEALTSNKSTRQEVIYSIRNVIFIHKTQDHQQEVTSFSYTLECMNEPNMSAFSRNGVRIWNSLPNNFCQMPKTKFKCNIHNLLLQELTEENEYIDLSDLPEYALKTELIIFALSSQLLMEICLIFL